MNENNEKKCREKDKGRTTGKLEKEEDAPPKRVKSGFREHSSSSSPPSSSCCCIMAPNLTIRQRSGILISKTKNPNATLEQIADENQLPRSTTSEVFKNIMDRGTVEPLPIGGSKEKVDDWAKRAIKRKVLGEHRFTPLDVIVKKEQMPIGVTKLRAIMAEDGFKRYAVKRAKKLSEKNIRDRKSAAVRAQTTDWNMMMYTSTRLICKRLMWAAIQAM
jgi:hypothetical protein